MLNRFACTGLSVRLKVDQLRVMIISMTLLAVLQLTQILLSIMRSLIKWIAGNEETSGDLVMKEFRDGVDTIVDVINSEPSNPQICTAKASSGYSTTLRQLREVS